MSRVRILPAPPRNTCEEDRTLRAVVVGMLLEADR